MIKKLLKSGILIILGNSVTILNEDLHNSTKKSTKSDKNKIEFFKEKMFKKLDHASFSKKGSQYEGSRRYSFSNASIYGKAQINF